MAKENKQTSKLKTLMQYREFTLYTRSTVAVICAYVVTWLPEIRKKLFTYLFSSMT